MNTNNTAHILSWIALIVAVIALILAWMAFNRAGSDVSTSVQQEVDEQTTELQENFSELEADLRAQFEEMQAEIDTPNNGVGTTSDNVETE